MTRTDPPIFTRDFAAKDAAALLQLNAGCRPHVAQLDRAELERLLGSGAVVLIADANGVVAGYLIAFPDASSYDGEEYRYFQCHLERPFLYIDQVAVASAFRRRGVARALYEAVSSRPGFATPVRRCCEVNIDPPNSGSMDFHRRQGFELVAEMSIADGRVVALLAG